MNLVTRFEADLLRILRAILRRAPVASVTDLILREQTRPTCLTASAVKLVRDFLRMGCVSLLAQDGGWRSEKFLRQGKSHRGRLWQRTTPQELGLTFSKNSLDFLIWLTSTGWKDESFQIPCPARIQKPGDEVLAVLTLQVFHGQPFANALLGQSFFRNQPVAWLFYADGMPDTPPKAADFESWLALPGRYFLEVWQDRLAARWLEMERKKCDISDPQAYRQHAERLATVLANYLTAVEKCERWDLARFVLQFFAELLRPAVEVDRWIGKLQLQNLRLAERMEYHHLALATVNQIDTLQRWERQARSIGFIDDGYHAAKFWLAEWERHEGHVLVERASQLQRALEPLQAGV